MSFLFYSRNPIDEVWGDDQPPTPCEPILIHPQSKAGVSSQDKVNKVRDRMDDMTCDLLVVTQLDEIAWLLNVRGADIAFNPVVISYVLVLQDEVMFFVDEGKLHEEAREHLNFVTIHPYEDFFPVLDQVVDEIMKKNGECEHEEDVRLVWADDVTINWRVGNAIPREFAYFAPSPIQLMKSLKNETEVEGIRQAHIRDGVALTAFFAWLEDEILKLTLDVDSGDHLPPLTECSIADTLEHNFRGRMEGFVSLSFDTIAGIGPNGAVIHYKAQEDTCSPITPNSLLLIDSGGQYVDGTTDITRTVFIGDESPPPHIIECFTRVLKGHISLARATFPEGTLGTQLDLLARKDLWDVGLDFNHGTGHGVGAFLNVHEGPQRITFRSCPGIEVGLYPGMVTSNEPGYYEDGEFGIRIENVTVCEEVPTTNNFGGKKYCSLNTVSLCPIQRSLIDVSMLTFEEKGWLNSYHQAVRDLLSPLMKTQFPEALDYLIKTTEPIDS